MTITALEARSALTALVIEDDEVIAHILQLVLERDGYRVARAATGRSAQKHIAESPPPDLVTLDGTLPDVSGFAVLERMRSTQEWHDVPVLLVTGYSVHERDVARALKSGHVAYIAKPFSVSDLTGCIRRLAGEAAFATAPESAPIELSFQRRYSWQA